MSGEQAQCHPYKSPSASVLLAFLVACAVGSALAWLMPGIGMADIAMFMDTDAALTREAQRLATMQAEFGDEGGAYGQRIAYLQEHLTTGKAWLGLGVFAPMAAAMLFITWRRLTNLSIAGHMRHFSIVQWAARTLPLSLTMGVIGAALGTLAAVFGPAPALPLESRALTFIDTSGTALSPLAGLLTLGLFAVPILWIVRRLFSPGESSIYRSNLEGLAATVVGLAFGLSMEIKLLPWSFILHGAVAAIAFTVLFGLFARLIARRFGASERVSTSISGALLSTSCGLTSLSPETSRRLSTRRQPAFQRSATCFAAAFVLTSGTAAVTSDLTSVHMLFAGLMGLGAGMVLGRSGLFLGAAWLIAAHWLAWDIAWAAPLGACGVMLIPLCTWLDSAIARLIEA